MVYIIKRRPFFDELIFSRDKRYQSILFLKYSFHCIAIDLPTLSPVCYIFHLTSWVAVHAFTPTDRPKSARNRLSILSLTVYKI